MSYFEMEGFLRKPESRMRARPPADLYDAPRMLHRWIAFLILAMLGVVMLAYLSAAAFTA